MLLEASMRGLNEAMGLGHSAGPFHLQMHHEGKHARLEKNRGVGVGATHVQTQDD